MLVVLANSICNVSWQCNRGVRKKRICKYVFIYIGVARFFLLLSQLKITLAERLATSDPCIFPKKVLLLTIGG